MPHRPITPSDERPPPPLSCPNGHVSGVLTYVEPTGQSWKASQLGNLLCIKTKETPTVVEPVGKVVCRHVGESGPCGAAMPIPAELEIEWM